MDLLRLAEQNVSLFHVSNHNGGEYAGPCPGCGGRDRFRVWPEQDRYWCRRCGKQGDTIQYLRDFRGLTFREAARLVGKQLGPYQPKPAEDILWRYLEEQYEAIRQELNLVEWASVSIPKNLEIYSYEERLQWAVAAVRLAEWYAQVETLWRKVEDGTRSHRDRAA
jgi:DNA primase